MIIFIHIFFIIFSSFCYAQSDIPINHLDNDYNFIPINLESHRKTVFLLDQNFPNVTHDVEYLNFKIDGSMNYPIYNSMPKRIFLTSSDTLTMSQISFLQDHSEYFYDTSIALKSYLRQDVNLLTQFESKSRKRYVYDTSIALKSYLRKDVNLLTQFESKSRKRYAYDKSGETKGVNYDQKIMTSIYKSNENSLIDAGYMYHYEEIPTYINLSDYPNDPIFRSVESYNFKLHYKYSGQKIDFKNSGNLQIANYSRPVNLLESNILEYLAQTTWNTMKIDYSINKKNIFNFKSDYKSIASDVQDNLFSFNKYYHRISLGLTLKHEINEFIFGIDNLNNNENYHYFNYSLNLNKFTFFISTQNNIYMNMNYSNDIYFIDKIISKNEFLGFRFKNTAITTSLTLGHHDIEDYSYFYYRLNNNLIYKWIAFSLSYNVYDSNQLFLKNHLGMTVKISPKIDNKRYRPYGKVKFNNLSINNNYKINQGQLNIYTKDTSEINQESGLSIADIELGVIFNYFKIAFIYENYYNKPFVYAYDLNDSQEYFSIRNGSDYLIEVTWIFKD